MRDSQRRSIFKALSWRGSATLATIALVYAITGRWDLAAGVGGIELFAKMGLYYVHERIWSKVPHKQPKAAVIWLTGFSGSGKTTIGDRLAERLRRLGRKVERLDGDVTRALFPNTGFSREDRDANVLKTGFLASVLERNGIDVIATYISPYAVTRNKVRDLCANFVEVHVATPLEVCESRDVKGLYAKARKGEITQFTGIDDPYEAPSDPELVIDTSQISADEACTRILTFLEMT
ncbi:MAG: adenylyl-sulfate kinase [Acidobacteria bacterium]|nr:adenylyl-sulfate kinase [Acidobacteriota bacterium]